MLEFSTRSRNKSVAFLTAMIMMISILSGSVFAVGNTYTELENHWAKDQVSIWIDSGIIKGYPDGTLGLDKPITRAELITLVNKSFGFTEEGDNFSDVRPSDWFYSQTSIAKKNGYLVGVGSNQVSPNKKITRQEVAVIVARIMKLKTTSTPSTLKDSKDFPEWSKGYINAVIKEGYMSGYVDGYFRHTKLITRAEAIVVLQNILKLKGKDAVVTSTPSPTSTPVSIVITKIDDKVISLNTGVFSQTIKVSPETVDLTVVSSNTSVVKVVLKDSTMTITPVSQGTSEITITASRKGSNSYPVTSKFKITVTPYQSSGGGGGGGGNTSIAVPTPKPTEVPNELVNVTVVVASSLPTFKNIKVNTMTIGTKFKIEGSTLVKGIGGDIVVNTSETKRKLSVLDANDVVLGTTDIDVGVSSTKNYTIIKSPVVPTPTPTATPSYKAKVTVVVASSLPTFKNVKVESNIGSKFKVDGSTLIKNLGEEVVINTGDTTKLLSILDLDGRVIGTVVIDVGTNQVKEYTITLLIKPSPTSTVTPSPTPTVTPTVTPTATATPTATVVPTPTPPIGSNIKMSVVVAEALPSFKTIKLLDAPLGLKFKVEGSSLVKDVGDFIVINSSNTTVLITFLDSTGLIVRGTLVLNISTGSENWYNVILSDTEIQTSNISVVVAESLPTFKSIKVISSTIGTKFKVEGSTLIKPIGETIEVNTTETTRIVSILNNDETVVGTVVVNVSTNSSTGYTIVK
jgi:hypothetical protein